MASGATESPVSEEFMQAQYVFANRLRGVISHIERQMEGEQDFETILRGVEERLEKLCTEWSPTIEERKRSMRSEIERYHGPVRVKLLQPLLKALCEFYGSPYGAVCSMRREKQLAHIRHIFFYLACRHMGATTTEVGKFVGRDHSTVIYGIQKTEQRMKQSANLRDQIEFLKVRYLTVGAGAFED